METQTKTIVRYGVIGAHEDVTDVVRYFPYEDIEKAQEFRRYCDKHNVASGRPHRVVRLTIELEEVEA